MKRRQLTDIEKEEASRLRTIWEEEKELRKKAGTKLTQEIAAEEMGFDTQGAVSQYLTGKIPLNTDAILLFCKLLKRSPSEIRPELSAIDAGHIDNTTTHKEPDNNISHHQNIDKIPLGRIPLIRWSTAGEWRSAIENGDFTMIGVPDLKPGLHSFALKVVGDSMEPELKAGETIIIEPDLTAKSGNYVLAMIGDEAILRQLWKEPGEEWELRALDKKYQPKSLTDCRIIGTIIYVQAAGRSLI